MLWSSSPTTKMEAIDAGISGFLPKPFFMTNFKETVDSILTNQETKSGGGPESSLAGKHFLIAEDVELNAEILLDILGERNATGETAENGKLAVELFERSPAGHFDAILMDVQMPVMNGYEATKAIRRLSHPQAKTIPILALTANAFAEDIREAMDAGMDAHIAKPINPVQLEQELHRILKSRESQEV